ncbi:MAG: acetyltransferase [Dethiobacteria bacterium]
MANKLVIIGAGGFAREVAWLIEDINKDKKQLDLIGFIDENEANHGKVLNGYPVLGGFDYLANTRINEQLYAVCAVGNPVSKKKLVQKATEYGLKFTNLIHPSINISKSVELGTGNIICAGNILTVNISIGSHVIVNLNCTVGHDVICHDYTTILPGASVSGNVVINNGCDIGTNASIIQGITIGEWSIIGAGAVVVRDIPPHCTAVGVPAKPIKFHKDIHEQVE